MAVAAEVEEAGGLQGVVTILEGGTGEGTGEGEARREGAGEEGEEEEENGDGDGDRWTLSKLPSLKRLRSVPEAWERDSRGREMKEGIHRTKERKRAAKQTHGLYQNKSMHSELVGWLLFEAAPPPPLTSRKRGRE